MPRSRESGVRRAGAAVASLLVVLLPSLVCGVGIDAPVEADEVAGLRAAIADPHGDRLGPAALFYGALAPAEVDPDHLEAAVPRARLATVLGVAALSGLVYLTTALARTRGTGLLACLALTALPSIADCTLRPEVPCAVFGLLGVLVLAGMPEQLRMRRRRSPLHEFVLVLALAVSVGIAFGLGVASSRSYGVYLLVPGGCVLLAVVLALARFVGMLRRRTLSLAPFRGFTRRVAPWIVTALAPIAAAALLLRMQGEPVLGATVRPGGLLPESLWVAVPLVACAAVGAILWGLQTGLELGRRRSVGTNGVVFVYAAAMLIHRAGGPSGVDALPATPALVIPAAIGARLAIAWVVVRLGRG